MLRKENTIPFSISVGLHATVLGLVVGLAAKSQLQATPPPTVMLIGDLGKTTEAPQVEKRKKAQPTPDPILTKIKSPTAAAPKARPRDAGQDLEDAKAHRGTTATANATEAASYASELKNFIAKNRFYPRRALMLEQTGTVKVLLKINPDGSFARIEVVEPSEYDTLNLAAKNLLSGLKSFKPLPQSFQGTGEFIVPINYQMDRESI